MTLPKCPTIVGLTFDKESQDAIDSINDINTSLQIGWLAVTLGNLFNIFGGLAVKAAPAANFIESNMAAKVFTSDTGAVGYNIYQTNWEYFFKSVSGLELFAKRQLTETAGFQAFRTDTTPKVRRFWTALYQGCKVN